MSAPVQAIRRFRYQHEDYDLVLELDTAILTEEMAHEINDFRSESESRLDTCEGDIFRVVGRMFALGAFGYMAEIGGAFITDRDLGREFVRSILDRFSEGWPDIETLGISIVEAYVPSFDFNDLAETEECQ